MQSGRRRNELLDLLKAMAIFGVCFIHGAWLLGGEGWLISASAAVFRVGVPAFLVLWSYFAERSLTKCHSAEARCDYSRRRWVQFFVLYLIVSMGYFLWGVDWGTLTWKSLITRYWSGYGWSGQYFLVILLQWIPLLIWYRKLDASWHRRILLCALPVYALAEYLFHQNDLVWKLGDRLFFYWAPYISLGVLLARGEWGRELGRAWQWAALLPLLIPIEFALLDINEVRADPYVTPGVLLGSVGLVTAFFGPLRNCRWLNAIARWRVVHWVGGATLGIFVLNPAVIMALRALGIPKLGQVPIVSHAMPFFVTAAIVMICLGLVTILRRTPLRRLGI